MASSMIDQFEGMTIGDLRKLHEDYGKALEVIQKQEETIKKLKIKYPNKDAGDSPDILKELGVEVLG